MANLAAQSTAQTLVQLLAPAEKRGRIVGVYNMASSGLRAGSGLSIGLVGGLIGIHWSLGLSALILVVMVVGLIAVHRPRRGSGRRCSLAQRLQPTGVAARGATIARDRGHGRASTSDSDIDASARVRTRWRRRCARGSTSWCSKRSAAGSIRGAIGALAAGQPGAGDRLGDARGPRRSCGRGPPSWRCRCCCAALIVALWPTRKPAPRGRPRYTAGLRRSTGHGLGVSRLEPDRSSPAALRRHRPAATRARRSSELTLAAVAPRARRAGRRVPASRRSCC